MPLTSFKDGVAQLSHTLVGLSPDHDRIRLVIAHCMSYSYTTRRIILANREALGDIRAVHPSIAALGQDPMFCNKQPMMTSTPYLKHDWRLRGS